MAGKTGAIRAGRAFVEIFLDSTKLQKGLGKASARMDAFANRTARVGKGMLRLGAAMAAPFGFAIKKLMDFDDAMSAVKARSGATAAEFMTLRDHAKKLGATTSFTASEVANLMGVLAQGGFDPEQIETMTAAVLDLARATGTEGPLAAKILGKALAQFGLGAGQAGRVADVLTAAANGSFTSVEALGEALKMAGPIADDFGVSLEETVAILGTLANVGIEGTQAGTALRRLLAITGAEAEKLQEIFGVAFTDSEGNARPLVDVLSEVNDATADLGTGDRAKKFKDAFGLLGITGASAISKAAGSARELEAVLKSSAGVANATAKEMDNNSGGAFRRLMSAIEGVALAVGDALDPAFRIIAGGFTTAAGLINAFVSMNPGLVHAIAGTSAALIIGGISLVALGMAAKVAAIGLIGLKIAVAVLTNPLGLAALAVLALGAAYVATSDTGRAAFGKMIDQIKSGDFEGAWQTAADGMFTIWNDLTTDIAAALLGFQTLAAKSWAIIADAAGEAANAALNAWRTAVDRTANAITHIPGVAEALGADPEAIREELAAMRGANKTSYQSTLATDLAAIDKQGSDSLDELGKTSAQKTRDARSRLTSGGSVPTAIDPAAPGKSLAEISKSIRVPDMSAKGSFSDVTGTFSGLIAGQIGATTTEERAAKAAEQTAENTGNIAESMASGLAMEAK